MDVNEIIAKFEEPPEKFPRQALEEAIKQKEDIIPELLAVINDPSTLLQKCEQYPNYIGHMYALFLLAQFRVPGTFSLVMKLFDDPSERTLTLLGDEFVIGDIPAILPTACEGDTAP